MIYAPAKTDWFNNPVPENGVLSAPVANAPFFYTEVTGDFVFRVKVRPNFKSVYDACALMVIQDEKLWTKAAFEKSDFGTTAAVCVVTNGVSDDANGCNIAQEEVWLQIVRVGDVFCTHYSLDGERFDMVRLFHLPVEKTVKVGIEAQSPAGGWRTALLQRDQPGKPHGQEPPRRCINRLEWKHKKNPGASRCAPGFQL